MRVDNELFRYAHYAMPADEDPRQLGREIRFLLTTQMGQINHRRMKDLLSRYKKCWKPTMCYYEMITTSLRHMVDLENTKEYTRYKLVDVCKFLLPPDGYVECVNLLHTNQNLPRMKEHAVDDIRVKMHKNLGYEMRNNNSNGTKYRNCGEVDRSMYLRYFNNAVHGHVNITQEGNNSRPNQNRKKQGNSSNDQPAKKPKTTDRPGKNPKNAAGLSKKDLAGLVKELKTQGLAFKGKEEKSSTQ